MPSRGDDQLGRSVAPPHTRPDVLVQLRDAERARRTREQELTDLARTVRELAERAQAAQLAEERVAEAEHSRKVQELTEVEDLTRDLRARRARHTVESKRPELAKEEKAQVARLMRARAEVRRAEARRDRARDRRRKITREFQDALRRIEVELASIDRQATPVLPEEPERSPPPPAVSSAAPTPPASSGARRPRVRLALGLGVAVLTLAGVLGTSLWWPTSVEDAGRPPGRGEETTPTGGRSTVPDLAGLSILEARDRLLRRGLQLDQVLPTPGPPGVVVRVEPASGRPLPAGAEVTLYVGVEPDRFLQELDGPDSPPPGG